MVIEKTNINRNVNDLKKGFLFDRPYAEITKALNSVVLNELNVSKVKNLPIVYRNSICTGKNQFIHQYPDGRTFLISQNLNNSSESIIRQL